MRAKILYIYIFPIIGLALLSCTKSWKIGSYLPRSRSGSHELILPRYDSNNTGFVDRTLKHPMELKWEFKTSAPVTAGILVDGYYIISGDLKGNIWIANAASGQRVVRKNFKGEITAPMAISGSYLVFALGIKGDKVGVIDMKSGKVLWERDGCDFQSSFAVDRDAVYIGDGKGNIVGRRIADGSLIWKNKIDGAVTAGCVRSDSVIYAGTSDGWVYAFDNVSGRQLWRTGLKAVLMDPMVIEDHGLFCVALDSCVYRLNREDGSVVWKFKTGGEIRSGIAVALAGQADGLAYVCSTDGCLYALNLSDAGLAFKFCAADPVITSPVVTANAVVFGSLDGYLYVVDRITGKLLFDYDAESPIISSPAVSGENIILSCRNRRLLALHPMQGS